MMMFGYPEQWIRILGKRIVKVHFKDFRRAVKSLDMEINTLPGMTPTSLVPQEAAQVGLNYGELCEKIVELSLAARKAARA